MFIHFIIFILAFIIFGVECAGHLKTIKNGTPSPRFDHFRARLGHCLKSVFGQTRITERWWGKAHVIIFYAFLIFLLGTIELLLGCLLPGWRLHHMISPGIGAAIYLIQNYFAALTVIAVAVLSIRRMLCRQSVHNTMDAWLILSLIFILMTSQFAIMASNLVLDAPTDWLARYLPLSRFLGLHLGQNADYIRDIAVSVHLTCVSLFLIWIPRGKHFHIVLGMPALWCQYRAYDENQSPVLGSDTPDLAKYEADLEQAIESELPESEWPTTGIVQMAQLSRKMRLETLACTQCRRCTNVCPMAASKLALGPFQTMINLRRLCIHPDERIDLIPKTTAADEIWNCTQCGACDRSCPMGIEHTSRIVGLRRGAVSHEDMPAECHALFAKFEKSGNPWGYPRADRMNWAQNLDIAPSCTPSDIKPNLSDLTQIHDILIFAGCMGAYDPISRKTLDHVISWLQNQHFRVSRLQSEMCCGEPMRKLGNETGFQQCMEHNIQQLTHAKCDLILTICPHCAHTLYHEYARPGLRLPVMHVWAFLAELYQHHRLEIRQDPALKKSFLHMPCNLCKTMNPAPMLKLTRSLGFMDEGRQVAQAHCCGAGGGQFFFKNRRHIADMRLGEVLSHHPEQITTSCPFCMNMIQDAASRHEAHAHPNETENALTALIPVTNVIDILLDLSVLKSETERK